jgi:protein TonB
MTDTALKRGFAASMLLHVMLIAALSSAKVDLRVEQKPMLIDLRMSDIPSAKAVQPAIKESVASKPAPSKFKTPPAPRQVLKPVPSVDIIKSLTKTETVETPVVEKTPDVHDSPVIQAAPESSVKPSAQQTSGDSGGAPGRDAANSAASSGSTGGNVGGQASGNAHDAAAVYLRQHYDYIGRVINGNTSYPLIARKLSMEGRVVLSFVIKRDGTVRELNIERSSGYPVLDKNAEESVKKSAPFAAPPVEAKVVIPITYRLN